VALEEEDRREVAKLVGETLAEESTLKTITKALRSVVVGVVKSEVESVTKSVTEVTEVTEAFEARVKKLEEAKPSEGDPKKGGG
jgi:hypothetical protein